ncbi:hypothetical protein AB0K00_18340 [Dactylosporangium sp. NPDC049525]|uniref:hypothetical protein n=1 Tax=Dactylosporangium sp. NPDC049525 TaxID=3154730 RepID=UPI003416F66A
MRRASFVVANVVPILLGLIGNVATGTISVTRPWITWLWVLTAALIVVSIMSRFRGRATTTPPQPSGDPQLEDLESAADQLARAVRHQWRAEEERRRIRDPFPLPVRWHTVDDDLLDSWSNIRRSPAGVDGGPLMLTGTVRHIADTFARIPSSRLYILGKGGSGKTVLAYQLVLDLIQTRHAAQRVPVMFSLGSWDPSVQSLSEWLEAELIRDYPGLDTLTSTGGALAQQLIAEEFILPVLDGFDEIADGRRAQALQALSDTSTPLVLTSRKDEFVAAVHESGAVYATAGIELDDLDLQDLLDYLPRTERTTQARTSGDAWLTVLDQVRESPAAPSSRWMLEVLATPLMVAMARAVYSDATDASPVELIDAALFPSAQAIQDRLLDGFIPAAYRSGHLAHSRRPSWPVRRSLVWLRNLAALLKVMDRRSIAWWELRDAVPRPVRLTLFVVGSGVVAAAVYGSVGLAALGAGLGAGVGAGSAVTTTGPQLRYARLRLRGRVTVVGRTALLGTAGGAFGGLVSGMIFGRAEGFITSTLRDGSHPSALGSLGLLAAGLLVGGALGAIAALYPPEPVSHGRGPGRGAAGGLVAMLRIIGPGLLAGLVGGWALGFEGGVALGATSGLAVGLATGLETPADIDAAPNPLRFLAGTRTETVVKTLTFAAAIALPAALAGARQINLTTGIALGFVGAATNLLGFGLLMTPWGHWLVFTRFWLPLTGKLPWRFPAFLEEAHRVGVLRQAGAFYQFRHARLQDRLCDAPAPPP